MKPGLAWADDTAAQIRTAGFLNMGVTYSAASEYGSSSDILAPVASAPTTGNPVTTNLLDPHAILSAATAHGAKWEQIAGYKHIFYVEGCNLDGTPNDNRIDLWNDVRGVLEFVDGQPKVTFACQATTSPGTFYDRTHIIGWGGRGAAIIAVGWQAAWQVGFHQDDPNHECLRQTGGPVTVDRDENKNLLRDDTAQSGYFGINHHGPGNSADGSATTIGPHSAGCLVAQHMADHRKFMALVKTDPRYVADHSHIFDVTVMPAQWVIDAQQGVTPPPPITAEPTKQSPTSMTNSFEELKPEYERLLATVKLTRPDEAMAAARKVIVNKTRYIEASQKTGVPWPMIGVLDLRESDCNPLSALGQGDPWNEVSQHVPSGKGPWSSWAAAAEFYIHYDHLDDNSAPWSMPYVCWKGEKWNGFGPRNHGIFTGYLWAGTSHYTRGKYVADGVWDANHVDQQLGIVAVLYQMVMIDASTYIGSIPLVVSPEPPPIIPVPAPTPFDLTGTNWIQDRLNKLMPPDEDFLVVDGNYGKLTRAAVRSFQLRHGLDQNGFAGDTTTAAMDAALVKAANRTAL